MEELLFQSAELSSKALAKQRGFSAESKVSSDPFQMSVDIFRLRASEVRSASEVLLHFSERQPSHESLAAFLACDTHYFLAASLGQVWTGFAYAYELSRPDGRSMMFLYSIDVDLAYRRRGIATAMLSCLVDVVEQRQLTELFVLADTSNEAAISFYRATGGKPEGAGGHCFVYGPKARCNQHLAEQKDENQNGK